jgi:hypothetical protein
MADACRVLGFILCTTNLGRPSDRRFTVPRQDGLQRAERT